MSSVACAGRRKRKRVDQAIASVIRSVPTLNGRPDAKFEQDLMRCMDLFTNLVTFVCTAPSVLPGLVNRVIKDKPRLSELKLDANLNRAEMELLMKLTTLKTIAFDSPTRYALDLFPRLVISNMAQLRSLSITVSIDLLKYVRYSQISRTPRMLPISILHTFA